MDGDVVDGGARGGFCSGAGAGTGREGLGGCGYGDRAVGGADGLTKGGEIVVGEELDGGNEAGCRVAVVEGGFGGEGVSAAVGVLAVGAGVVVSRWTIAKRGSE